MKPEPSAIFNTSRKLAALHRFMSQRQIMAVADLLQGEEGQFFIDKIEEITNVIDSMPKTYETDGQGNDAVIRLHYFTAGCDWWIIEKDMEVEQHQAFGFACLNGDWQCAESGYISLPEILEAGAELDFHWKPITLGELKRTKGV